MNGHHGAPQHLNGHNHSTSHVSPRTHLGKRSHTSRSTITSQRTELPIYAARTALLQYIDRHDNLIIMGETGSGKTTQLAQYIYEEYTHNGSTPYQYVIGVTQPRRIAATSVAARVAAEVGCELGSVVGYSIRFDDRCSASTRIKYMTDGMLLREVQSDPLLQRYSVIVLDEVHSRSVSTDILCAILKQIQAKRAESKQKLKLICMSATLQANEFSTFFNGAPIVYVQGRQYHVDVLYTRQACLDYVESAVIAALQIHLTMPLGDILIFLSGSEEIESARRLLNEKSRLLPGSADKYIVTPIYSTLSQEQQSEVFEPTPDNTRKIIVATNIAETSVTIPNIVYVIDSGIVKQRHYYNDSGVDRLVVVPVSRAEAFQRTGRAGRVRAGQCYRLMPESAFLQLRADIQPEIEHADLATIILQLMCMNIKLDELQLLSKPRKHAYLAAYKHLLTLDAIDEQQHVTHTGRQCIQFPLSPQFAKMVLLSCTDKYHCSEEILSLVAMMSTDTLFTHSGQHHGHSDPPLQDNARKQFSSIHGDHVTYLRLYQAYCAVSNGQRKQWCIEHHIQHRSIIKATQIRDQLVQICHKLALPLLSCHDDLDRVRRCLLIGLCTHVARLQSGNVYQTLVGKPVTCYLHPSSVLIDQKPRPDTVIYTELLETNKLYIRDVTMINATWLTELLPKLFASSEHNTE